MSAQSGNTGLWRTILFVDVCGSTKLYETLGNQRAQAVISKTLVILSDAAKRHLGTIVKYVGDEVMCTFPLPHQAVDAVLEMQQNLRSAIERAEIDVPTLAIRAGFHCGPVIDDGADVYGDAVNVAARVAGHAKPNQILITKQTATRLPPAKTSQVRFIGNAHLKGKRDTLELFEVITEGDNVTKMQDVSITHAGTTARMTVVFRTRAIEISEARPSLLFGRGDENDVVVLDPLVSRLHARIEHRRGRFVLVDQSLNGTFLALTGRREVAVRRDEFTLIGSGVIALGKSTTQQPDQCIDFTIHGGQSQVVIPGGGRT